MDQIKTNYWDIVPTMIFILISLGILTGFPAYLVAAVIPAIFLFFSYIGPNPDIADLTIERSISDKSPRPGKSVKVKLKVRNTGSSIFTDLRVVDGVAEELKVCEGSPRSSMFLPPEGEKELSYNVRARKGKHSFNKAKIGFSNAISSYSHETEISGDTGIKCGASVGSLGIRENKIGHVGNLLSDEKGSGLEFHSLRNYQSSDPLSRIEWRHLAKTGNLATKNFRKEQKPNLVLILDLRSASCKRAETGEPLASELCIYAAKKIYDSIADFNKKPGLFILGINPNSIEAPLDSRDVAYISPGYSRSHDFRVKKLMERSEKANKIDDDTTRSKIFRSIDSNSQIIVFTPLIDEKILPLLKNLTKRNQLSAVISPDITYSDSMGSRLERIRRDIRINKIRRFVPVLNWSIDMPLSIQIPKRLKKGYKRDI